jgi:hypothetical protein
MKTLSLKYLPGILLLRSDVILWELLNDRVEPNESKEKKRLNFAGLLQMSMHEYRPDQFRQEDIKRGTRLLNSSTAKLGLNYSYNFLRSWYDELFQINGSEIHLRPGQEEIASVIFSKVHPYTIIAFYLAKQYNTNFYNINDLLQFARATTPLASIQPTPGTDYADNHIHIYGAQETGAAIMGLLEPGYRTNNVYYQKDFAQLPHATEFQLINSGKITIGFLIDLFKLCSLYLSGKYLSSPLFDNKKLPNHLKYLLWGIKLQDQDIYYPDPFLIRLIKSRPGAFELFQSTGLFQYPGERNKELFIYCIFLHYIHSNSSDSEARWCSKISLHIINILRSFMVMSQNTGLANFADFYDSKLREENWTFQDVAANIIQTGTTKIEGKISPKALISSSFFLLADALDKEIVKRRQTLYPDTKFAYPPTNSFPLAFAWKSDLAATYEAKWQYHFVVHFIRENDKEIPAEFENSLLASKCPVRFESFRKELEKQALGISRFINGLNSKAVSALQYYISLRGLSFSDHSYWKLLQQRELNLSNLIVGIDVAGKETATPPEVFAPVILFLRSVQKTNIIGKNSIQEKYPRHRRLLLSVHAGEDFSHILTGMRRIDETVIFYGMDSGDRIGHALALGIPPIDWLKQTEEILITCGENLDNLVWLYHHLVRISEAYDPALPFLAYYQEQISIYSQKIYGKVYPQEVLFYAWRMRSNCPISFFDKNYSTFIGYDSMIYSAFNFSGSSKQSENEDYSYSKDAESLFDKYHRDLSIRKKMDEVLRFDFSASNKTLMPLSIGMKEVELWEALQDYLMSRYADKGLIIEANPSSNIYISKLKNYGEHPIFRFSPPKSNDLDKGGRFNKFGLRESQMPVCVNTDDPSIFPTTLPNEFKLLKHAAKKYHNCSDAEADQWLGGLQKFGVKIFLNNHQPILV